MAVTDTHFLELDATDANDIALSKGYTHAFTASKVQVPPIAYGPMITVAQALGEMNRIGEQLALLIRQTKGMF